jgi:hypothetical protein
LYAAAYTVFEEGTNDNLFEKFFEDKKILLRFSIFVCQFMLREF